MLPVLAGCASVGVASDQSGAPAPVSNALPIRLRDIAAARGLRFRFSEGDPAQRTILQTSAGGAGFLDYDGDGNLDVLLLGLSRLALFHNDGRGGFQDVTAQSGLGTTAAWMGCAAGDYDNDGRTDLFLAGYHCARLYHNEGGR